MPSEPRSAPFRMPERTFAELAAGGGSPEAVAFLERAERARRLLLLRTLLDRLGTLRTPLSPAAEAWAVLKDAAAAAPGPVDRLARSPRRPAAGSPPAAPARTARRRARRCGRRRDTCAPWPSRRPYTPVRGRTSGCPSPTADCRCRGWDWPGFPAPKADGRSAAPVRAGAS
ncbi:hypothetical protein [Streptomyces afghaniensis]|uniref:hypothetical protein n=1 Tax=Streptomyces afghaniensis TaxID=66865 RepID=UPI00246844AE|nr:hypothetical protein [Streptomyces afghaniensis]